MGSAIFNGMGGISVENIKGLMKSFKIPEEHEALLMERILIFASEFAKESQDNGTE